MVVGLDYNDVSVNFNLLNMGVLGISGRSHAGKSNSLRILFTTQISILANHQLILQSLTVYRENMKTLRIIILLLIIQLFQTRLMK